MKKKPTRIVSRILSFTLAFMMMFSSFTSVSAKDTGRTPGLIPNSTYIIGTHEFTSEMALTTSRIMIAARTIQGDNLTEEDMVIYYKNPYGDWINATNGTPIPQDKLPQSFTITHTDLKGEVVVDKTVLENFISTAENNRDSTFESTDGSDVDPLAKWVTQAEMDDYRDAIEAAQTVADKADATLSEVDAALLALSQAMLKFDSARKDGTLVKISAISVDKEATTLPVGTSETLVVTFDPTNATNKNITWSTSDASVATVADGVVTAVAEGTATITATSINAKTATTTVTVVAENTVAMIGPTQYDTLEDAVARVLKDETITLVVNASGDGIVVPEGKNFTLDLGGNTYTVDGDTVGSTGTKTNGFQLLRDSNITIQNGKITTDKAKILIQNYSNLTLDKVELVGADATDYVLSNNFGNTTLKNGTTITAQGFNVAFDLYYWPKGGYPSVTVEIASDDVVITGNVEYAGDGSEGLAENAKLIIPTGYTLTPPAGYKWVAQDGKQVLIDASTVAMIDAMQYADLQDAINEADDKTIKLVADVEFTNSGLTIAVGKDVTLDLAGHVLSGVLENVGGSALITNSGSLTIEDSSTNKTGKITNQAENPDTEWAAGFPAYANNTITNSGELIINGGHIENTTDGGASYVIDNNSGNGNAIVEINGGYIVNPNNNVAIRQFANSTKNNNSVTINGGIVEGTRAVWIQLPGSSGQEKLAKLTVNGGTLKSTDKGGYNLAVYSYTFGDSFAKTEITITGGTFDGDVALTGGTRKAPMETVEVSDEAIFLGQRGVFTYANVVNETQNNGYTTIQAAINEAAAGDEIIVGDGDYTENLTIDEAITLKSLNGRESTEIAGTITITANDVTVEGFTVTAQGHYAVPVIHMIDIDNVNILNNTVVADDTAYGAIGTSTGPAKVTGIISGNTVTGMIIVGTDGDLEVRDNVVTLTSASSEGITFYPVGPTAVITVTGNTVGAVTEGNVQIKVNERPASVNEKTTAVEMLAAISADNNGATAKLAWLSDSIAVIGATGYLTLQEAIDAASSGATINILSDVSFVGVQANGKNLIFVGTDAKPIISFPKDGPKPHYDSEFTFKNLTLDFAATGNYHGIQPAKLTVENSVINGILWGYANDIIVTDSVFNQNTDGYNMWTYGSNVTIERSEFNSLGRSLLIYNEGGGQQPAKIVIIDSTFNASEKYDKKAAIEIDASLGKFNVEIENTTATGFDTETEDGGIVLSEELVNLKKAAKAEGNLTVSIDGVEVYPNAE